MEVNPKSQATNTELRHLAQAIAVIGEAIIRIAQHMEVVEDEDNAEEDEEVVDDPLILHMINE
jgi:hypothetical protein